VKERWESGKAAKNTHVQNIRMMEEATRLLAELGVLRKDLPERHNKSYDSTILDALNKVDSCMFLLGTWHGLKC
jgi:hypothetical protein